MKRYLFICALVGAFTTSAAAQPPTPQTTPPRPSPTTPQTERQAMNAVTVEGCLMREADVGRQPNVAERAGIGEDFVLANAKVVKGKAPDVARTGAAGATREPDATRAGQPSAGQVASMQPMYEVSELDDDRLKTMVGKRVQIEGTFEDTDRQPAAGSAEDLVELHGTSIREVPGTCPAPRPQQ
jgi:hypothetical protein